MGPSIPVMPATSTDVLLLVDKPAGITSFDAVRVAGRVLGTRRVGHTGTLDPFATGLLVMLAGRGTRLIRYVPGEPKVYRARIVFGAETDTHDATGTVVREDKLPAPGAVRAAIPSLTGSLLQMPPEYSARKVGGTRAYALARRGVTPDLAPTSVTVSSWDVLYEDEGAIEVRITCGGGTYVRALARDLGRACESAAHLAELRRERSGPFTIEQATNWDDLRAGHIAPRDLRDALAGLPQVSLDAAQAQKVRHGMAIPSDHDAPRVALLGPDEELLGVARREGEMWQPETILPNA